MQQRFTVDIDAAPARLFALVSDLGTYDRWLDIVHRVEPAPAEPGDPGPAWFVTLRARLGPLARSKRLRMARTTCDEPTLVRFERHETDGRQHSAWVLESAVTATGPDGATVAMSLAYDGPLWSSVLEGVLGTQVDGAGEALRDLATGPVGDSGH